MYQLAELIESISSEHIWEHIFQKSNLLVEQRIPWLVVVSHTVADPTHRKSSQREKNTNTNKHIETTLGLYNMNNIYE
jgi:hypothetical protein